MSAIATPAIEQAFIEIFADATGFDEDLRQQTQKSLTRVEAIFRETYEDMELGSKRAVNAINQSFASILRGGKVPGFDQIVEKLLLMEHNFERLGDVGRRAFKEIENAAKRAEPAIVAGPAAALRELEEVTDRFGTRFRASFGRAAIAGPAQLEASLKDLTDTGEREFNLLREEIDETFRGLGNVPGLERLEGKFDSLAHNIQADFAVAVANSEDNLKELARTGELTTEKLDSEVTKLAVLFDSRLGEAVDEVSNDLRRLSGDARVFDELAQSAARAERETEQLQDALLQMERADHEQLANDFLRATRAIETTEESVENVTRETRQATVAVNRLGDEARRTAAKANRGFGRMVASMNRLRFLALDARFLITGIGVFAAAQFARFGIEATSEIEQVRLSFQTISKQIEGDLTASFDSFAGKAEESLSRVIEFARETPFAITDVADAVRRIAAFLPSFQIADPDQLDTLNERTTLSLEIFKDIGGALAVLGQQDALPRLVKALGDVGAAGKLTGEEVRQLRNALPGVNIREAIITGIFDPSIQASDSIRSLREEFTRLGADATKAPVEATAAFVEMQRQGLITTDAVVQGLRSTLRNLAGDEALENFTLTIAGSMEKVKESIEVGLFRGLEDLGPLLVDQLLPALDDIQSASTEFGDSIRVLAEGSLPLLITGFEQIVELGGEVFSAIAEFSIENRSQIERGIQAIVDMGGLLTDILFDILDATAPLIPALLELVNAGLTPLADIIEAISPLVETLADAIGEIPGPALAVALGLRAINRALTGQTVLRAAVGFERMGGAIGVLGAVAKRVALVGVVLAIAEVATSAKEGTEEAEKFIETLERRVDTMPGIEGTEAAIRDLKVSISETRTELNNLLPERSVGDPGGDAQLFRDLWVAITSGRGAQAQIDRSEESLRDFENRLRNITRQTIPAVRGTLLDLGDGFDRTALRAALTEDQIIALADGLGVRLTDDVTESANAMRDAIADAGGLGAALLSIGENVPSLDNEFDPAIASAEELETAFRNALTAFQDLANALRAQTDPFFALLQARQASLEAQQAFIDARDGSVGGEGADFADAAAQELALEQAALGQAEAALSIIDAFKEIAAAVGDEDIGASLSVFEDNLEGLVGLMGEGGPEAAELLSEKVNEAFNETLPAAAELLGITGDRFELFEDGIRNGADSIIADFGEIGGGADGMGSEVNNAIDGITWDEMVDGANTAFRELPSIFDTALGRIASTLASGNPDLFTSAFTLGSDLLNRIQAGLASRGLLVPDFNSGSAGSGQAAPSANPSGSGLSPGSGRSLSGTGVTVNQTISTSDPEVAGRTAVRQLNNELFLNGLS